jgi:hypothetical protein
MRPIVIKAPPRICTGSTFNPLGKDSGVLATQTGKWEIETEVP